MTPCEKLGYKVGDRFIAQIDGEPTKKGDILALVNDDGSRMPYFRNERTQKNTFEYIEKYDDMCPGAIWVLPETPVAPPPKKPIEYLKAAHADGDLIDPATMLHECFGITKTERVVVEWSEAKQEIKVGDKVRIVGNKYSGTGYAHRFEIGDIVEITEIDPGDEQPYKGNGANMGWLAADDVELI